MCPIRRLDAASLYDVLMGAKGEPGVFERVIGFRTSTGAIKAVHVMNDLAQSVLGGVPAHRGEHLCRVIREDKLGEPNSDAALREDPQFGGPYRVAYPEELGPERISHLREAAGLLLNADDGMYRAGDRMASSLAPHWTLLGEDGFRRFRVGRYIEQIIDEEGRASVERLFCGDEDPVSRALKPLMLEKRLEEKYPHSVDQPLTPFDQALGRRLSCLTRHKLSKPTRLRAIALASSLGVTLKILGVGQEGGRPALVALPDHTGPGTIPARAEAVRSFKLSVRALDEALARGLAAHPRWDELWSGNSHDGAGTAIEVPESEQVEEVTREIIEIARERGLGIPKKKVYWPDKFALSLGKKAGCVAPKRDQAGWGKRLVLTPELVEILVLMFVPPDHAPLGWREFWRAVSEELGIIVGANSHEDDRSLKRLGLGSVDLGQLEKSSERMLEDAIRRGVARRLPDSGAEVGGELI